MISGEGNAALTVVLNNIIIRHTRNLGYSSRQQREPETYSNKLIRRH